MPEKPIPLRPTGAPLANRYRAPQVANGQIRRRKDVGPDQKSDVLPSLGALARTQIADAHHAAAEIATDTERGRISQAEVDKSYLSGYSRGYEDGRHDAPLAQRDDNASWSEMATFCLERANRLSDREKGFVQDMVRLTSRGKRLTPRQQHYLESLYRQLRFNR